MEADGALPKLVKTLRQHGTSRITLLASISVSILPFAILYLRSLRRKRNILTEFRVEKESEHNIQKETYSPLDGKAISVERTRHDSPNEDVPPNICILGGADTLLHITPPSLEFPIFFLLQTLLFANPPIDHNPKNLSVYDIYKEFEKILFPVLFGDLRRGEIDVLSTVEKIIVNDSPIKNGAIKPISEDGVVPDEKFKSEENEELSVLPNLCTTVDKCCSSNNGTLFLSNSEYRKEITSSELKSVKDSLVPQRSDPHIRFNECNQSAEDFHEGFLLNLLRFNPCNDPEMFVLALEEIQSMMDDNTLYITGEYSSDKEYVETKLVQMHGVQSSGNSGHDGPPGNGGGYDGPPGNGGGHDGPPGNGGGHDGPPGNGGGHDGPPGNGGGHDGPPGNGGGHDGPPGNGGGHDGPPGNSGQDDSSGNGDGEDDPLDKIKDEGQKDSSDMETEECEKNSSEKGNKEDQDGSLKKINSGGEDSNERKYNQSGGKSDKCSLLNGTSQNDASNASSLDENKKEEENEDTRTFFERPFRIFREVTRFSDYNKGTSVKKEPTREKEVLKSEIKSSYLATCTDSSVGRTSSSGKGYIGKGKMPISERYQYKKGSSKMPSHLNTSNLPCFENEITAEENSTKAIENLKDNSEPQSLELPDSPKIKIVPESNPTEKPLKHEKTKATENRFIPLSFPLSSFSDHSSLTNSLTRAENIRQSAAFSAAWDSILNRDMPALKALIKSDRDTKFPSNQRNVSQSNERTSSLPSSGNRLNKVIFGFEFQRTPRSDANPNPRNPEKLWRNDTEYRDVNVAAKYMKKSLHKCSPLNALKKEWVSRYEDEEISHIPQTPSVPVPSSPPANQDELQTDSQVMSQINPDVSISSLSLEDNPVKKRRCQSDSDLKTKRIRTDDPDPDTVMDVLTSVGEVTSTRLPLAAFDSSRTPLMGSNSNDLNIPPVITSLQQDDKMQDDKKENVDKDFDLD